MTKKQEAKIRKEMQKLLSKYPASVGEHAKDMIKKAIDSIKNNVP